MAIDLLVAQEICSRGNRGANKPTWRACCRNDCQSQAHGRRKTIFVCERFLGIYICDLGPLNEPGADYQ